MTRKRPGSRRFPAPAPAAGPAYDPDCRRCPRLARHLAAIRGTHPDYFARPVPAFGAADPRLLVVGLAPGLHGANASGRPFTGDHAGILLYRTLHAHGFASGPESRHAGDGLVLIGCRITNAVKCLPPENRPTGAEIRTCNAFLEAELAGLGDPLVILALGHIAHGAVLRAAGLAPGAHAFGHGRAHRIGPRRWLLDSYHCSRYNTQTRRLTPEMFDAIFQKAHELLQISD